MCPLKKGRSFFASNPKKTNTAARLPHGLVRWEFEYGNPNVSRWMTWLPISLKNAAKCDKWYQLQNHSITESLNANGARWRSFPEPIPCMPFSQCRTKTQPHKRVLVCLQGRGHSLFAGDQVVIPSQPSNRRFMDNSIFNFFVSSPTPFGGAGGTKKQSKAVRKNNLQTQKRNSLLLQT